MNFAAEQLTFSATAMDQSTVELPFPIEFETVKSFDSPAHSFEGIFYAPRTYPPLAQIQVYAGDQKMFKGLVDEQTITENDQGRQLKLLARSKGGILLDNEAYPIYYPSATMQTLYLDHIKRFQVGPLITDLPVRHMPYQITKGTSEWEAFSNFVRNNLLGHALVDEDDNIVCRLHEPETPVHWFSSRPEDTSAIRYSSLKITDNRYAPITKFYIRDNDGSYSYNYVYADAQALGLQRERYLIPAAEFSVPGEGIGVYEAKIRAMRAFLGRRVITVTCPLLPAMRIGERARLDTALERFSNLYVQQVRYHLSAGGITTTVTLLDYRYMI